MALRALLRFRNLDRTRDINDRFSDLFFPGVFEGGAILPVVGQLKVDVEPFKAMSIDGMVVEETSDTTRLDTPDGQITVIALRAIYVDNNDPDIELVAIEESAFNVLPNKDKHIVFGHIDVSAGSIQVDPSDIDLEPRDTIDRIGRNFFRGVVSNAGLLPPDNNVLGDFFMVVDGVGGPPNFYGWDGDSWEVMTDFVSLSSDLANHRNNLFPNEKHLTDDEKDAVVGTSGTPPSLVNPFVDNADTRIPTQDENDALAGSDGSPSASNRYVTEEFPLAVPEEKVFIGPAAGTSSQITAAESPIYVGKQGVGSANIYFQFYESTTKREYTTSTGLAVNVIGVFTDVGLTSELNPSTNANVDADGFFTGDLFIRFDVAPDTTHRLLYGKRQIFKTFPIDALLRRTHNDAQASADVVTTVEAIKGRDWDDTPPTNETNIELRKDIVDTKEYINAVFFGDHVVGDFTRVENVPDFVGDFITNIGIPPNYSFENVTLEAISYDPTTGRVTYGAVVPLGSVLPGHVFIDGSLVEFRVVTVVSPNEIDIVKRDGTIPPVINTTVTTSAHGSIKPDNNPRKINLSTLDYICGRERIPVRQIEPVLNEFNLETKNIAYQVRAPLRSPFYREPRLRMYGGFENRGTGAQSRVVVTNTGRFLITGFFTDLRMFVDLMTSSPMVTVKVDGLAGTVLDLSRGGTVADLGAELDIQQQAVTLATALQDNVPHTVEVIVDNAPDDFIFYGLELSNFDMSTTRVLPGRAFVQADLYKNDAIVSLTTNQVDVQQRGTVVNRFINRSLAQQSVTYDLTDFDGAIGTPAGTATSGVTAFTITSGFAKFANYKVGDIVKLVTATTEEVKQIDTIGPGVGAMTFTSIISGSGSAILLHVASTNGESADPEQEFIRYRMTDLGTNQLTDFSTPMTTPADRTFTTEDGTTSIAGTNVAFTTTGIDGVDVALNMVDNTSTLKIRALASRLDLIVVNDSAVSADFAIDGAPPFTVPIAGTGLIRIPTWLNARYQTHELTISTAAGLAIAGIILHEPTVDTSIEGTRLAAQNFLARHAVSRSDDGDIIPTGSLAIDPHSGGGVYVNGAGTGANWTFAIDFTENDAFGRFAKSDREGSYFEFVINGEGFEIEYFSGLDRGIPVVFLNGVLATSANFPGATFKGVDSSNGKVNMFSVTTDRKKLSVTTLPQARYVVRLQVQSPREKDASSFGFFINSTTFYEINSDGRLSISPSRGFRDDDFIYGLDSSRDERNFDSGAVAREEVPVLRTIVQPTRSQRVALLSGSTSVAVAFTTAFDTADYSATCTMTNTVDGTPKFQPITITSQTAAGFTAEWNDPLDTGNYFLNYTAIEFI